MSIATALENEFTPEVRGRGQQYFRHRKVRLVTTRPALLEAEVEGSTIYRVFLTPDGDQEYGAYCSCPAFEKYESCKHLWATLLEADARNLAWLRSMRPGHLVPLESEDVLAGVRNGHHQDNEPGSFDAEGGLRPSDGPSWRSHLNRVQSLMRETPPPPPPSDAFEVLYVLDVDAAVEGGMPVLELCRRQRKTSGEWGALRPFRATPELLAQLSEEDRPIFGALQGARSEKDRLYFDLPAVEEVSDRYLLDETNASLLIPMLCSTGRFYLRRSGNLGTLPLEWPDGEAWTLGLSVLPTNSGAPAGSVELRGYLARGEARMDLSEPDLLLMYGQLFAGGLVARFDARGAFAWVNLLREHSSIQVPATEQDRLVERILDLPQQPLLDLPEPWVSVKAPPVRPHLLAEVDEHNGNTRRRIGYRLSFLYGDSEVDRTDTRSVLRRPGSRELFRRRESAEQAAVDRMLALGARPSTNGDRRFLGFLAPRRFPEVVRELLQEGWKVEAEGRVYRPPGKFKMAVSSGVDWFDLHGQLDFQGVKLTLPELLKAARGGKDTVVLSDGSVGLLPEEWLKRCGLLASLGAVEDEGDEDSLRFQQSQAFLLDALLAAEQDEQEIALDERFSRFRRQLEDFRGVSPLSEPETFQGELREYQRDGLGWFSFLREFSFGGCLADDMGLGKTVQVLALLEERRLRSQGTSETTAGRRPSLVVVPRSLVFNWLDEASRFTPDLKVVDYTGVRRKEKRSRLADADLVITTYGVLRRDILYLKSVPLDYAVLDEAQAIKNADSQSAKASRLLDARFRLALSGTPIENHLGELWSLFEYLNPGMLGRSSTFRDLVAERSGPDQDRDLLARAVRPFILRRTKEQVVRDLPEKSEQTLHCDMKPRQRKLYNELRDHYRASLMKRIDTEGINRSRMHVLEALLRLRQASCHPGLIGKEHRDDPSAKLEVLLPKLLEVCEQGHRALVFSQFTSLLAIVRQALDAEGLAYEYLDGQTRDRQQRVANFQSPDGPPVFLISLRAGGLGLNLTAADYVFILDPWWNPAVEAQAIDRAHRIGQTRRVLAYRLICRDTVEEKILELQQEKRDLADAIIQTDGVGKGGVLKALDRRDLEVLLS